MDYTLPVSSVRGIFQARVLEWVAFPTPEDLPDPGIKPVHLASPALADGFFTTLPPGKPLDISYMSYFRNSLPIPIHQENVNRICTFNQKIALFYFIQNFS